MYDQAEKLRQLVQNAKVTTKNSSANPAVRARVIAITSGKGGVGKTNFTVNLAITLANSGQKVLIIDADLGTANVDVVLGCTTSHNLLSVLEDGLSLDKVIADGPCGIKYLSGGSGIHSLANLTNSQLYAIINQISSFDTWADIILIDTGAGLSRNVLNFVVAADEVIIITTPEPTAITDAYAMMKAYKNYQGSGSLKLIVNRVMEEDEGELVMGKLTNAASRFLTLSVKGLGVIYEDRNLIKAVKSQTPVVLSFPESVSTRCIEHIAQRLLYGKSETYSRGIKGFFTKVFEFWKQ